MNQVIVLILGCFVHLLICVRCRLWCPPETIANRTIPGYNTAIIAEIHKHLYKPDRSTPFLLNFRNGDEISRFFYHHIGIMGVNKIYVVAFYDPNFYPRSKPSIEDIFPSSLYCVTDWFRLGVIDWRSTPYEQHPLNDSWYKPDKVSMDRDYYKTIRGYNPIYAEIMHQFDWIFVIDTDEYIFPINFNANSSSWCELHRPPLVSFILNSMLMTAASTKLTSYEVIKRNEIMDPTNGCLFEYSFLKGSGCVPIQGFSLPVYTWLPNKTIPLLHSRYPSSYSRIFAEADVNGQAQTWKSVYRTKYNPPLVGRSLHCNHAKGSHTIMAPRKHHGGMSLAVAHVRGVPDRNETLNAPHTVSDESWRNLFLTYQRCVQSREKRKVA